MKELIKIIKDFLQKKRLKKILKRSLLKMPDKKELNNGEYFINGKVMKDTDIVNHITEWASKNFVFKANDVYMPYVPAPLFGVDNLSKHDDLNVESFIPKYGNIALKYLLYNIFILGYESGIERGQNDSVNYVSNSIEKIVDESKTLDKKEDNIIEKVSSDNIEETKQEEKVKKENAIKKDIKTRNKSTKKNSVKKNSNKKKIEDKDEEEKIFAQETVYDEETKNLIVDSNLYSQGTYQKYISMIIEKRLGKYGLKVEDIYNNIPSYILAEVLIDINDAETVNDEQIKIKQEFYDYFKNVQEILTKENTKV